MESSTCRISWNFLKHNKQPGEDIEEDPAFGECGGGGSRWTAICKRKITGHTFSLNTHI